MGHQRDLALSARSFLRPVTSRRVPLNPDLGYWGGVTWVWHSVIDNGAGASGTHEYDVSPGIDNEMMLISGSIYNGDATAREALVQIEDDEENVLGNLVGHDGRTISIPGSGRFKSFPSGAQAATWSWTSGPGGGGIFISGEMVLHGEVLDVGTGDETRFAVVARVRGDLPTVTHTHPAGATVVINKNKFF